MHTSGAGSCSRAGRRPPPQPPGSRRSTPRIRSPTGPAGGPAEGLTEREPRPAPRRPIPPPASGRSGCRSRRGGSAPGPCWTARRAAVRPRTAHTSRGARRPTRHRRPLHASTDRPGGAEHERPASGRSGSSAWTQTTSTLGEPAHRFRLGGQERGQHRGQLPPSSSSPAVTGSRAMRRGAGSRLPQRRAAAHPRRRSGTLGNCRIEKGSERDGPSPRFGRCRNGRPPRVPGR